MQRTLKNRTIFCRDNLEVLRGIDTATVDLIYLDPPFNKKKEFSAPIGSSAEGASFQDIFREEDVKEEWLGLIADKHPNMYAYVQGIDNIGHKSNKYYLCYMAVRLIEMHRMLKKTGSLYLHCDPTMGHYLKLLLDCIFGEKNFRNEIIWHYKSGGRSKIYYSKKHDNIFWYVKSSDYIFNLEDIGEKRGIKKRNNMKKEVDKDGRVFYSIRSNDKIYKYYADEKVTPDDVWTTLSHLQQKDPERVGYPTQKPIKLIERIIKGNTRRADLVLDPFCGCATTCVAAEKLDRQWIGIDVSKKAFELVKVRLEREVEDPIPWKRAIYREDIPQRTDHSEEPVKLRAMQDKKRYLYGLQNGKCKGCNIHFYYKSLTIEHIFPKSKGGGDNIESLLLLCGHCNSIKGNRDTAYLQARLKESGIIN